MNQIKMSVKSFVESAQNFAFKSTLTKLYAKCSGADDVILFVNVELGLFNYFIFPQPTFFESFTSIGIDPTSCATHSASSLSRDRHFGLLMNAVRWIKRTRESEGEVGVVLQAGCLTRTFDSALNSSVHLNASVHHQQYYNPEKVHYRLKL